MIVGTHLTNRQLVTPNNITNTEWRETLVAAREPTSSEKNRVRTPVSERFFFVALRPSAGHGLLILEVSRLHTTTHLNGRTPLDEWSARRRDLYLTTHNIHNRQTSMPPAGFEATISAGEQPQTYALDRMATGTGVSERLPWDIMESAHPLFSRKAGVNGA